jgi:nucleotide-binding universal stress UspA family protein
MSIPYRKILAPLDGSALAEAALPHATAIARQSQAELTLLQVVPPVLNEQFLPEGGIPPSWAALDEQQRRVVEATRHALEALAINVRFQHVAVTPVVQVGDPAERIVDYAIAHDIDLIVMCTHGRTGVQRWLLGSVANKVMSAAPCPVLVVRAQPGAGASSA